jgi:hypothetical protein
MPSFSELPGSEGVCISGPALVSQSLTRSALAAALLVDQQMKKRLYVTLAWTCLALSGAGAVTLSEDFSADPRQRGWQVFGDTNLFAWDSTNQNLLVTWDSRHPNSYFYIPLGLSVTRYDDFSLEFDLRLSDVASGVEPGKTGPLQLGLGFLNLAAATRTNFMRGAWGAAPDVAEFAYYTFGYYDYGGVIFPSPASAVPSFIPGTDSFAYAPIFVSAFEAELPTNKTVHVRLAYTAENQTAQVTLTAEGASLAQLPPLVLSSPANSQFSPTDTFRVDTLSISSYSSTGDDYDSLLAHGTVDNLVATAQVLAITRFAAGPGTNGFWQARFLSRSNWLYTLDRSVDLRSWTPASLTNAGIEDFMVLQDSEPPGPRAFFRVRAQRP